MQDLLMNGYFVSTDPPLPPTATELATANQDEQERV